MKCDPVGMRADNPLSKNHIITETTSRATLPNPGDAVATLHNRTEPMAHGGQTQQDALRQTKPLVHPQKTALKSETGMYKHCTEVATLWKQQEK